MDNIKFGTDGWRAVVGRDFTQENVARIVQAFADLYPKLATAGQPVIVGYDRRNQSPQSARLTAEILLANNIPTILSSQFCPTPTVSWMIKHKQACAGIMITASHNPPGWNGVKFKESYGGSASSEFVQMIEKQIGLNGSKAAKKVALDNNPLLTYFNPHEDYLNTLKKWVNCAEIAPKNFHILADPLYGAGTDYFTEFGIGKVTQIHTKADITFGGLHPEPIIPYVNEAIEEMKSGKYDICLITDGDADRIGAVDEKGNFVTSHQIFALLLNHLISQKKWRGEVIKSITTTQMINRICEKNGLKLTTTPVGFKYISPLLNNPDVLMGGEESGGIGIPRHVCERDGVLCGILLVEILATRNMTLSALVDELQKSVGPCFYQRIDYKLTQEKIGQVRKKIKEISVDELAGLPIKERNTMDGLHFLRSDDSWLLMRPSGTEPLVRTYAEARSMDDVTRMLDFAKHTLEL